MSGLFSKITKWIPVGEVPEVTVDDLKIMVQNTPENVQILDVRTAPEWASGHIPGAMNLPLHQLSGKAKKLRFDKEKLVVAICLSAHRSIPAVRHLNELGYEDVKQLAGGMKAWNQKCPELLERKKS